MEERVKKLLEKHKDDKDLTSEKGNIYPGMDWSGVNLGDWNLSGLCLSDFQLQANFSGANLHKAILDECILTGANFQNSNLCNAYFEYAELGYVNFRNARMVETHLNHAKIQYAKLENATLYEAILEETTVSFSNLKNTDFRGADLSKADFANSNLEKAKFDQYTKLHNVRLFNCNLEKSTLKNAVKNLDKIIIQERENRYEEGKQIYLLLKNYFKQEGMYDISGEYYYREKIMETKCYHKERKWSNLLFNILLNLVAG